MDIDLKLLGPYASKFQKAEQKFKAVPSTSLAKSKPPLRANFGALHKKQNVRFLQDVRGRRNDRHSEMEDRRKERRSQLFMNGRKPNMAEITNELNQFIHEDSSNEISAVEVEFNPAAPLSQVLGNNSNPNSNVINGNIGEGPNGNASSSKGNEPASYKNVKATTSSAVTNNKLNRHEQLLKWKREKEAADMIAKRNQRQPFKAGLAGAQANPIKRPPPPQKNVTSGSQTRIIASSNSTSTTSLNDNKLKSARQPAISASAPSSARTGPTQNNKAAGTKVDDRRVTRAMSKGTNPPTAINSKAAPTMKPAIQKMKNLQITEKTAARPGMNRPGKPDDKAAQSNTRLRTAGPGSKGTVADKAPLQRKPSIKSKSNQVNSKAHLNEAKRKDGSASESSSREVSKEDLKNDHEEKAESNDKPQQQQSAPKKKLKPRAIDTTYIDYNSRFSNACLKLKNFSSEWSQLVDTIRDQLTEKVHGDILSALGKVKLLLESKLPQFGELLYSYLCQEVDPNPVLACDLQGWWDVVTIQLEAVDSIFDGLAELRRNNWETVKPVTPPKTSKSISQENEMSDNISQEATSSHPPRQKRAAKPVKAQASGGLRAFLASQRKMLNNAEGSDNNATTPTDLPSVNTINNESGEPQKTEPEKTFEGGFFTICSPKPQATPNSKRREMSKSAMALCNNQGFSTPSPGKFLSVVRTPPNLRHRLSNSSSDASFRRQSLSILGVRRSMGSFNKIGVVPLPADDKSNTEENKF